MSHFGRRIGLAALLAVQGCGGQGVRVAYEIATPPPAPLPVPSTRPPVTASTPAPPPSRRPATTSPAASPRPADGGNLRPHLPEGVPIRAVVPSDTPYAVLLRLRDQQGRMVAEDQISENGLGVKRKLETVAPGRYRLELLSWPLLEDYPLYDRIVELNPAYPPTFHFGLLSVSIPEEGKYLLEDGLRFRIQEEPSLQPVFEGKLSELALRTTFGDILRGSLILPFGEYSIVLEDPVPEDDALLLANDGLPMEKSDPVPFELTEEVPSVLLDFSEIVGFRGALEEEERRGRSGGSRRRGF